EADQRERRVEEPLDELIQPALSERDREVVLLALVVDDVRRPHEAHAVAHSVKDVVREVHAEEPRDPRGHRAGRDRGESEAIVDPRIADDAQDAEEDGQQLLPDAAAEVRDRVDQPVAVGAEPRRVDKRLDAHQDEEERDHVDETVHAAIFARRRKACSAPVTKVSGGYRTVAAGPRKAATYGGQRVGTVVAVVPMHESKTQEPSDLEAVDVD